MRRIFAGLRRRQGLVEIKHAWTQGSGTLWRLWRGRAGTRLGIREAKHGTREEQAARGPGGLAAFVPALPAWADGDDRQGLFQNHQDKQAPREHFQPDKTGAQDGAFGPLEKGAAQREPEAQPARAWA